MKAWVCNYCHAKLKEEKKPDRCQLCGRLNRNNFTEIDVDEPSKREQEYSKKYQEVMDKLEEYTEGTDPIPSKFAIGECCGVGEREHKHKR
ncbi:MAG: hypothetical protein ABIA93_04400 [Candidatus Woesearchaeota archaeon]